MSASPTVYAALVVSAALITLMFVAGGRRNIMFYVAAYFAFFAYGPVLNLLRGEEVYEGIVLATVDEAVIGFVLAIVGIVLADRLVPQRKNFDFSRWESDRRSYPLLAPLLTVLVGYGLVTLALVGPSILSLSKHARFDVLGPGHRTYLFLQFCAVAFYFIAQRNQVTRRLYTLNVATYIAYCVVSAERDFIYALFALALTRQVVAGLPRFTRTVGISLLLVATAVGIVVSRSGQRAGTADVLNQGSILFVDTYVHSITPRLFGFEYGDTYVNSVVNLLPGFIYSTNFSLAAWLRDIYAPTGHSGYGFSLTGEAYLNFGYVGIPAIFFIVFLMQRLVVNKLDSSPVFGYAAILYTTTLMYSLRGDSLMLLKGVLYGLALYACVTAVRSGRRDLKDPGHSSSPTSPESLRL